MQFQSTLPTRGSDRRPFEHGGQKPRFQSTLPTRGSDSLRSTKTPTPATFQSTLPTRGSDQHFHAAVAVRVEISIHAPHEGERPGERGNGSEGYEFQSTLPTRGSDGRSALCGDVGRISIHAPHEGERRAPARPAVDVLSDFNPRSPRGGATRMF